MTPDKKMKGSQALVAALEHEGCDVLFAYPGGVAIPFYDALYDARNLRHILVRHEQGAAHAADGYARATGKVGVCTATSGPGATNLVTGIATAYLDSSPLVAITWQVRSDLIGTDAFQEADITGVTFLPISAGSTSAWITLACGANALSLPVTRSSKRAPMAMSRSHSCTA